MIYKPRVKWSAEEEVIIEAALKFRKETGRNIKIEDLVVQNADLYEKYKTNPKCINNKLASMQCKPTKYKPRTKWSDKEEDIILEAIHRCIKNNTKVSYKDIAKLDKGLEAKYNENAYLLKNKVTAMKRDFMKAN